MQRTLALQPTHLLFRYSAATEVIPDSVPRVNPLYSQSNGRCWPALPVAPVFLSWIGFVILPSRSSFLINVNLKFI